LLHAEQDFLKTVSLHLQVTDVWIDVVFESAIDQNKFALGRVFKVVIGVFVLANLFFQLGELEHHVLLE